MACYSHLEALRHHWVTHVLPCHHHLAAFGKTTCSKLFVGKGLWLAFWSVAGTYYLNFTTAFDGFGDPEQLQVNIVPCPPGFVTGGRDDTCNRCPEGLYSFGSLIAQCSICQANFECPGGATVWPESGFWHSAPRSIQVHR
jgi:hypothetical protein